MKKLLNYIKWSATVLSLAVIANACQKTYRCKCTILQGTYTGFKGGYNVAPLYDTLRVTEYYDYKAKNGDEAIGICNREHGVSVPTYTNTSSAGNPNGYSIVTTTPVVVSEGCIIEN